MSLSKAGKSALSSWRSRALGGGSLGVVVAALLVACSGQASGDDVSSTADGLVTKLEFRGVNFGAAAFAPDNLPGIHGTNYTWPDPAYRADFPATAEDYYFDKGVNTVRLPFLWERLQPTLNGEFDAAEFDRLKTTVATLVGKGAYVIIDPHNSARYRGGIVGDTVPVSAFQNLWSRLAAQYKNHPQILFGLMNEPHDMPTSLWLTDANAAISAIRSTGANNLVLVPGNDYTGAFSWESSGSGDVMLGVVDSANNYAYEVHQYLDGNSAGQAAECVSNTIGAERMAVFTNWARAHGKRGFLGELGSGTSATCLTALDGMVQHLEANSDVYLGWTYWAAGPGWPNDYWMTIVPQNGADTPQMKVLAPYFGAKASSPAAPPSSNGSCTTYHAENISHANGGPAAGGWNMYGNGAFTTAATFAASSPIVVTARGTSAAGQNAHFVVTVDGQAVGNATVGDAWADYTFQFSGSAGSHELAVVFDNDAYIDGQDRNLIVGTIVVGQCSAAPTCEAATLEAESDLTHSNGGTYPDGWNLWGNGTFTTSHDFAVPGEIVNVVARGTSALGVGAHMIVSIGGIVLGGVNVGSDWAPYAFTVPGKTGNQEIVITFDNDLHVGTEDRNLAVDKITVECP